MKLITHQSSQLLLSGFLFTDEHILIKAFTAAGFKHVATSKRNEWISMLITKS
jgi:ribosomal protein L11 methylase PrmA